MRARDRAAATATSIGSIRREKRSRCSASRATRTRKIKSLRPQYRGERKLKAGEGGRRKKGKRSGARRKCSAISPARRPGSGIVMASSCARVCARLREDSFERTGNDPGTSSGLTFPPLTIGPATMTGHAFFEFRSPRLIGDATRQEAEEERTAASSPRVSQERASRKESPRAEKAIMTGSARTYRSEARSPRRNNRRER